VVNSVGEGIRAIPSTPVRLLAVNGLGLYAMLMYGITYYAVTTAAPRMAAEFGYPGSALGRLCCEADAWSPGAARCVTKRQILKQHEIQWLARVPLGSDIWSRPCCDGNQMSEPEH